MRLEELKFAEGEFDGRDIASLDDRPKLSAAELKAYFDNVSKNMLALGRFNDLIDWLLANDADVQEGEILACLQEIETKLAEINEALAKSSEAQEEAAELLEKTQSAAAEVTAALAALQALLNVYAPVGTVVSVYESELANSPYAQFTMGANENMCHRVELPGIGGWFIRYTYGGRAYTKRMEITGLGITQIPLPPKLEDAPWEFIDAVSTAGLADQCWEIGDTKSVSLSGTAVTVRILDFYHDLLEEPGLGNGKSTRAGITFALTDTLSDKVKMHSASAVTAWADRDMITTVLPGKLAGLPTALQNVIKTVNKVMMIPEIVSEAGSASSGMNLTAQGAEFMASQLFLLSERELFGEGRVSTPYYSFEDQYEYFRRCNSPCASQDYWLRSQLWTTNIAGQYASVLVSSGQIYSRTLQCEYGLLFGFCV